ncbi:cell division protein FtsZ [Alloscardovia macacae]|uniref:Cell division protein FtsZ n=1 Tax=Alloscardovia macacae TaxID=1160091 RepID=A0A261F231_9BIFI|nr:cell division protein FtsZ [Alloscardovia macacae]OZG53182.1 cell division protein FtsZ [Alloscardovia macacae]
MSENQEHTLNSSTVIKVVGVGGAGGNAVNRMIGDGLTNVEFVAINTDDKDLARSEADVKISLADDTSRGLGAGADPERGAKAAQDHQSDIEQALKGSDLVFITAGEGGGTGTGASPIVARAAREQGALTVAVVSRPFSFEGRRRSASAEQGIEKLRGEVDALIVISNDRLLDISDRTISMIDAFHNADQALLAGVKGITEILDANAYINVDFADVTSVLKDSGTAIFGMGRSRGQDRAVQAMELAMSSPMLDGEIDGANGILVTFFGAQDMGLFEMSTAMDLIHKIAHPDANIIWGSALDDTLGDEMAITVIATGFGFNEDSEEAGQQTNELLTSVAVQSAAQAVQAQMDQAPAVVQAAPAAQLSQPVQSAQPVQAAQPDASQSQQTQAAPVAAPAAQPVSAALPQVAPQAPAEDDDDEGYSFDDMMQIPEFLR